MHAPHFLLIFKISEVRHLDVSAFSGRRDCGKAVMHLDLRSSFEEKTGSIFIHTKSLLWNFIYPSDFSDVNTS